MNFVCLWTAVFFARENRHLELMMCPSYFTDQHHLKLKLFEDPFASTCRNNWANGRYEWKFGEIILWYFVHLGKIAPAFLNESTTNYVCFDLPNADFFLGKRDKNSWTSKVYGVRSNRYRQHCKTVVGICKRVVCKGKNILYICVCLLLGRCNQMCYMHPCTFRCITYTSMYVQRWFSCSNLWNSYLLRTMGVILSPRWGTGMLYLC